jgi:hypothetical protein
MGGIQTFNHLGPVTTTPEQRDAVRRFIARHAHDLDDEAELLQALGLEAS